MKTSLRLVFLGLVLIALAVGYYSYQRVNYARTLRLAERGNIEAMVDLGRMYVRGRGIGRDDAKATKWFLMAAKQGSDYSLMRTVGMRYLMGTGVQKNLVQAHMWFSLSDTIETLDPGFVEDPLDPLRGLADAIASDMTRGQIAEAQRLAREWMAEHSR